MMFKMPAPLILFLLIPTLVYSPVDSKPAFSKSEHKHRGVSWVGGAPVTEADFEPLRRNHVNWIVQTPFGWQSRHDSPEIRLSPSHGYWGETDEGIRTTAQLAKRFGIKTLLKPHIWLSRGGDGKWRGEIEMNSEEDWHEWFAGYTRFMLHYATLAQENEIEALSIGTELYKTAVLRENDWRVLIAEVRKVFKGKVTYSANWYLEFNEIQFWDALDFIGIQAYFPLTRSKNPSVAELRAGWRPHRDKIQAISKKFDVPVIFTEIGYKSTADTAIEPWEWPRRSDGEASSAELQTQANCYEAFFQSFWQEEWCAGAYFWKWFPKLSHQETYRGRDFTPQHKPAELVMAKWYRDPTN